MKINIQLFLCNIMYENSLKINIQFLLTFRGISCKIIIVITNQLRNGELQMKTINHTIVLQRSSIIVGETILNDDGTVVDRNFNDNHIDYHGHQVYSQMIAKTDDYHEPIYLCKISETEYEIDSYYIVNHVEHRIGHDAYEIETINYTEPLKSDNDVNAFIEFAEILRKHYKM